MIDVTVDISVFDRIKKRVSDLNTKDILRDVANAVYAHLSERVHIKGKATDGTKIGKYSNPYMKVRTGNFGNTPILQKGRNKGKTKSVKDKKGDAGVYTKGEKKGEQRLRFNRSNDPKVVLSLTREMENDMKVFETNSNYIIGFSNPHNYDKAVWNGKRYGKNIWKLSAEEEEIVRTVVNNKLNELLNE